MQCNQRQAVPLEDHVVNLGFQLIKMYIFNEVQVWAWKIQGMYMPDYSSDIIIAMGELLQWQCAQCEKLADMLEEASMQPN